MRITKTSVSVILGVLGLFMWIFPPVGFASAGAGLIIGIYEYKNNDLSIADVGIILNIIGLIICTVYTLAGIFI